MLFNRDKRIDQTDSSENNDQAMPNKVLINRGSSESTKESTTKTLDDLGVPPPPPSSSPSSTSTVSDEAPHLKPLDVPLHETSEASLPEDYKERLKAFNFEADPEVVKEMQNNTKPIKAPGNTIQKTVVKDLSRKAIDKVEKIDSKTKETLQGLKKHQKEFESSLRVEMKELKAEYKDLLKKYNAAIGENETILAENKEFAQDIHMMIEKYKELLAEQKKNNAFIEKFHTYLDPLIERERKIISDNEKIAK